MKSMTAFALYEQPVGKHHLSWTLRSVNHRYLDVRFKLPEGLRGSELALKARLAKRVGRGHIEVSLTIKAAGAAGQAPTIDPRILQKWHHWQAEIMTQIPDARPLTVMEIIMQTDIFDVQNRAGAIKELDILVSFEQGLDRLLEQRSAEGGRLKQVLKDKIDAIAALTASLKGNISNYEQAHQANWQARFDKLQADELDPIRLHQEIALLLTKSDITEELDRLESHLAEFDTALQSKQAVGRRLDFLLQEFNREANTLGSKSIHQDISKASVEMKVLIDQIREQVQNIE